MINFFSFELDIFAAPLGYICTFWGVGERIPYTSRLNLRFSFLLAGSEALSAYAFKEVGDTLDA